MVRDNIDIVISIFVMITAILSITFTYIPGLMFCTCIGFCFAFGRFMELQKFWRWERMKEKKEKKLPH